VRRRPAAFFRNDTLSHPINMAKKLGLPLVEVSGKPFDMGRQAGRKCSARARAYRKAMAEGIKHSTGADWDEAVSRAKLYLPYAQDFYPGFLEELKGYAEGSKIPFGEVFCLTCHELLSGRSFKGCTDIVVSGDVTEDGSVLAGHNEDWDAGCLGSVVLLHAKPKGKPEFVCTSYAGLVPSTGMNSAGISLTGNALNPNDTRVGIPKMFAVRKIFEARRIGEAIEYALPAERASSYNNICTDRNGEIYSIEGSATDHERIYALDGYLVHTNHYTAGRMTRFEEFPYGISGSVARYNRAHRLVRRELGHVTLDSLKAMFRDHVNRPDSLCRHPDTRLHRLDRSETIFSVIYDLGKLEAHVCKGNPCKGGYETFSLRNGR
jgi:isopenicillin-N N-acyltransferase-like protein